MGPKRLSVLQPRGKAMSTATPTETAKWSHIRHLFRLRPFDTSTAQGRAQERHRRIALTTAASAAARGISILTVLVSIPLAVRYLGPERYGLWATISSTIAILGFADAGLGNGLITTIAEAHGASDRTHAQRYVSSALFMLCGVASGLAILFAVAYHWVPWPELYNVSSAGARAEAGIATAVFAGCFLVSLPLSVVEKVQLGYQEGYVNGLWQAAGSVLGLIGVLIAIALEADLPWLVLSMAGAPVVSLMANGAWLFGRRRSWLAPRLDSATWFAASRILRLGLMFFVLQISVAVAFTSDNIIVAQLFGASAVTEYFVPMRLFSAAPLILMILFNPLWPAYGEAVVRGDRQWASQTLRRSLVLAVGLSLTISAVLVILGGPLVHAFAGPTVSPSLLLLSGLGLWAVFSAAGNAISMFLNGLAVVRFQVVTATLMASAAVSGKILLGGAIGLPGVIWGTIIAYTLFVLIPSAVVVPRMLTERRQAPSPTVTEVAS
jgi:O-antigen/teichoic acid export membrane protein